MSLDFEGWKKRITRFHKEKTILNNVMFMEEKLLSAYMANEGYFLSHPTFHDNNGELKEDQNKWIIQKH